MDNKTKIGKDVIESLTLGMYEDSRFIYREYIQNSADQIDTAVEKEILVARDQGKIEITINKTTRSISIYDNATGIKSENVQAVLKNIAQGIKDRTKHKGFRGIGRLGGLAYCDKLIFETSSSGEDIKSVLVWDAKKLKEIINNRENKEDATTVIDTITKFNIDITNKDDRYFKVTLENVSNDLLLDEGSIITYLSMVAPVSYKRGFLFQNHIYDKAKTLGLSIDEYPIYVNNNQVFKSYTTSIYEGDNGNKKKIDEIHEIKFFECHNSKDDFLCWGWYSISKYTKVIPKVNCARGIRLRKGNIQIGLDGCLIKLFNEQRGSFYFFGEVFAVNKELIPNARRDYFIENNSFNDFEKALKLLFLDLHKLYHFSSTVRNENKKIDTLIEFKKELKEKNNKGFTNDEERKKYDEKFETVKANAKKAHEKLKVIATKIEIANNEPQKSLFKSIIGDEHIDINMIVNTSDKNGRTKFITDELSKLNRKEKKLVSKIFSVIDVILTPDLANNLKEKIKEELK